MAWREYERLHEQGYLADLRFDAWVHSTRRSDRRRKRYYGAMLYGLLVALLIVILILVLFPV
jgi:hypothetical protein